MAPSQRSPDTLIIGGDLIGCLGHALDLELPVAPVKGQILLLRSAPDTVRRIVKQPGAYVVPRVDRRVLVGATMTRAYPLHDLLTPLPFGDYGQLPDGADTPGGLAEALARFARALAIRRDEAVTLVGAALGATEDYVDRVRSLTTLPDPHRRRLEEVCLDLRRRLAGSPE